MESSLPGPCGLTVCRVWPEDVPGMAGGGCVCRVWPEDVPGMRGWVRVPRLAGDVPGMRGWVVCRVWPEDVPGMAWVQGLQRSKALAISSACCSACFLLEPVAGEADGARDATRSARVSPSSASA